MKTKTTTQTAKDTIYQSRTKTKSVRVEGSEQFVTYTEHMTYTVMTKTGDIVPDYVVHTLRVVIAVGGYANQSEGRIERWNGSEWKIVASIPGSNLFVPMNVGYTVASTREGQFYTDRKTLLGLAGEIL
jgi:hypothetical protein